MSEGTYWSRQPRAGILGGRASRRALLRGGGLAGVGLAGAALIGCGDDDDDVDPVGPPLTPAPGTPTPTPTTEDEDGPRQGGTFGMPAAIPQDNFNFVINPGESGHLSPWHVYDMLLTSRLDDRVYVLEAAESVELPDETTVIIKLKPGLVYQDRAPANGRAVDAEDTVVLNDYVRDEDRAADPSFQRFSLDFLEATDDRTLVYHLRQPNSYLFTETQISARFGAGPLVPREIVIAGELETHEPVGSGPYQLRSHQFGVRYEYERNPTYRDADQGLPYIDTRVRLPMVDASALEAAFRGEQIHQWIPPAETADRIARDLGDQLDVTEFVALNMVTWNMASWPEPRPFDDMRVREGFYRAFNADEFIDLVADGRAVRTTGKLAQGHDAYVLDEADSAEFLRHDSDEARQLLDAAGFDLDQDYELTTITNPVNDSMLQVLQEQWRRIGVQTRLISRPASEWLPEVSRTGNYDFAAIQHPPWGSPQRPMRIHHTDPAQIHLAMNIRDPEIDAMIEDSERIMDRDAHVEAVKEIQRELLRRYSHLSYVYTPINQELRWAYVRDWELSITNEVMYRTETWMDI